MGGGSHEGRTFTEEQGENSTNLVVMLQKKGLRMAKIVYVYLVISDVSLTLCFTHKKG